MLALRRFRPSLFFATAILPTVAWNAHVVLRIPGGPAFDPRSVMPFWGLIQSLWHPTSYPFGPVQNAAIRAFDGLELAGLTLALALAFRDLRKARFDPVRTACLLWAVCRPGKLGRLPLAMVVPRVWLELTPQVLGVLRGFRL
jgi:hypothetical protein